MSQMDNPKPTPVDTTDETAQAGVTVVETLINQGESVAEGAIIAAEPVMATPVLKQLWETILDKLIKWILQPLILTFTDKLIVNAQEYFALKKAAAALAALNAAKQTGDPNAVAQASAAADQAAAPVIQFIGATHS